MAHVAFAMPVAKRVRLHAKISPALLALLAEMGKEDPAANQQVYLVTVSRVVDSSKDLLDTEKLDREQLSMMIRDAANNPVHSPAGGAPRKDSTERVEKLFVFLERHADGSKHFHAALKLYKHARFNLMKVTLRQRHKVASHWSCRHTMLYTVVRYLHVPSLTKPHVDDKPYCWTNGGEDVDLFEESQEPFNAEALRKRREKTDKDAWAKGESPGPFDKLAFRALVMSKHLHTKAAFFSYVQKYGTVSMQKFAANHHRKITEYIEDAHEWADAQAMADDEALTDWEFLLKACRAGCAHPPGECTYAKAVEQIFLRNEATLSPNRLAASLRDILTKGPSKTCKVPFLIGPSNTGKSTLLYPFDDLYGPKHVLHKPALGSTFGLRNIQKKRFIFWDDYRPVEFAHEKTVPVATFLSLFIGKHVEIQASQSFSDGNPDVKWNRGVVFTAKKRGLWDETSRVSSEDIRHIRNRVEEFEFTAVISGILKDVEPCAPCMAKWISEKAAAWDASRALMSSAPAPPVQSNESVVGFDALVEVAKIPAIAAGQVFKDVVALGAADVVELTQSDWQGLPSWHALRPLEQRRLLTAAAARGAHT